MAADDASNSFRIIDVAPSGNLTLKAITVSGGRTPDGTSFDFSTSGGDAADGGGIFNAGTLTLQHTTVTRNVTGNGGRRR